LISLAIPKIAGPTIEKAKVALARKLAVIMHRILTDGTPFKPSCKAKTMAAAA
jgi:hypothetical protein